MTLTDWQRFFQAEAPNYHTQPWVPCTDWEVRWLAEQLRSHNATSLLDLGCGTGRHSIPLAQTGFNVTGVDLSQDMLNVAQTNAEQADVQVRWIQQDAAQFCEPDQFDAAICLCEGAMCLLGESDDADQRDITILRNVYESLKPGGVFYLTVLSVYQKIREIAMNPDAPHTFNPIAMTEHTEIAEQLSDESTHHDASLTKLNLRERMYTPPEMRRMLQQVGFAVIDQRCGQPGQWDREELRLDDYEFMSIAQKPVST